MSKNAFIILGALFLFMVVAAWGANVLSPSRMMQTGAVTTFEECAAKYPVMESYPRQCRTPEGKTFVEKISPPASTCRPTGCSGEICAGEDAPSICIYRSEFACYKNAVCERQPNGNCGWTPTKELLSCLEAARNAAP